MAWKAKPDHILVLEIQTLDKLTGRLTKFHPGGIGSSFEVRMGAHL